MAQPQPPSDVKVEYVLDDSDINISAEGETYDDLARARDRFLVSLLCCILCTISGITFDSLFYFHFHTHRHQHQYQYRHKHKHKIQGTNKQA